jgi:hypothetical protein
MNFGRFFKSTGLLSFNGALVALVIAAADPSACSGPITGAGGSGGTGGAGTCATGPIGSDWCSADQDSGTVSCENISGVTTLPDAGSLDKLGNCRALKLRIVSADPPAPAKFINTWKLQVLDSAGGPVAGAGLRVHTTNGQVDPFMPCHGHYSTAPPVVTSNADGTFTVTPVYFFMAGVWQARFDVTAPDGRTDVVEFDFCIQG